MGFTGLHDYKKDEVNRYINGYEIRDIEKLEDDPKFMAAVCTQYGCKSNIYRLCSDKVKANYDFVDMYLTMFYDSYSLLADACFNYVKFNSVKGIYDEKSMEVLVRTYNSIIRNSEFAHKNKEIVNNIKALIDKRYNKVLEDYESLKVKNYSKLHYLCNRFGGNTHISSYFVNIFINDYLNDETIKENLHLICNSKTYKSLDRVIPVNRELTDYEKMALCLKLISDCDKALITYLSSNSILYSILSNRIKAEFIDRPKDNSLKLIKD